MTATYTFDVFSSLDGFGGVSGGDWGGYWGKQGPELLDHRLALYDEDAADGPWRQHISRIRANAERRAPRSPRCATRGSPG